jgi:hypothetical protein
MNILSGLEYESTLIGLSDCTWRSGTARDVGSVFTLKVDTRPGTYTAKLAER